MTVSGLKRADQILVDLGLAPSRTKAQELIDRGAVWIRHNAADWKCVTSKSNKVVLQDLEIEVRDEELLKYASRAGLKLESALQKLQLNPLGAVCLDVGASTGGFTDCLLQNGAAKVDAIDVGHDQLDQRLRSHPKVRNFEGLNIKDLDAQPLLQGSVYDIIVADVSFISLTKVLPHLKNYLKKGGHLVALVKPQFEVGAVNLDKRGVVRAGTNLSKFFEDIQSVAKSLGWIVHPIFPSGLAGRDGNQEYFLHCEG